MMTREIEIGSEDSPNEQGHYDHNHRIIVFYKENKKKFEGKARSIDYLWKWLVEVDDKPPLEVSEVVKQHYEVMKDAVKAKTLEITFKNEVELVKGKEESKAPCAWIGYRNLPPERFEPWRPLYHILNWILDNDKRTRA